MWLVAGLGNPGSSYRETRHNVGFLVADRLADHNASQTWQIRGDAHRTQLRLGDVDVRLIKPQTFMNRSGEAVAPELRALDLPPTRLVVVHDDVDLPLGRLRVKAAGGHGGHNGLRSLVAELDSRDFFRVRVGIGRPPEGEDVVPWVLGAFAPHEQAPRDEALERAVDALSTLITEGFTVAANRFNAAPRPQAKAASDQDNGQDGGTQDGAREAEDQDST